MNTSDIKSFIIQEAQALGFENVGFAKADYVGMETENKLREWLSKNYHGSMSWMENYLEKRLDPRKLVEGCKTVICFTTNYFNGIKTNTNEPHIAQYALGDDYHDVLKKKLKELYEKLTSKYPEITGRYFTDTAPILERFWAEKSGVGWVGKNTLLITRNLGSYVFLSEMLINVELEPDKSHKNYCGTCSACIDKCPTNAFVEEKFLDSNKCISYLTIEYRDELSEKETRMLEQNIYGCDICQEVCPWNKFAKQTQIDEFLPRDLILSRTIEEWSKLSEDEFREIFRKSAVKRTKFKGLTRNIHAVKKNIGYQ